MVKPLPPGPNLDDVSGFTITGSPGDVFVRQGDQSDCLYFIEQGQVELLRRGRPFKTLSAGDFFGEATLVERAHAYEARAASACRLLKVDASVLDQLVSQAPEIGLLMSARLARRLGETSGSGAVDAPPPVVQPTPATPIAAPVPEPPSDEAPAPGGPPPIESPPPIPAPAAPQRPRLLHEASNTEFPLAGKDQWLVGRLDVRNRIEPDVDFTALDPRKTTGRRHAVIHSADGQFLVREDKATANGTFINGRRIPVGEDVAIKSGDRLQFGHVEAIFLC